MKEITFDKVARFFVYVLLAALLIFLLWRFSLLMVYGVIALVLSYVLDPVVNRMQTSGMNRTLAIAIVLTSLILVIIWASTTIIPNIGNQIARLAQQFNVETINYIAGTIELYLIQAIPYLPEGFLVNNVSMMVDHFFNIDDVQNVIANIFGLFTNLFTAALIVPFATFFFLRDGSKLRRQVLRLVPNKYFEMTMNIINKIETRLGAHFRGVGLQSTLVAFFSTVLLGIAGLNNALSVGVAIGLANTIPYFGPILGYFLSIVIAIIETGDFSLVINCILAVMVVQIMDNIIFQPFIFSRTADLHPLYVLFIILIGAELGGLVGMLVAIPIATVLRVIITQIIWSFKNYNVFRIES